MLADAENRVPVRSTLMLAGWRRRAARAPSETVAVFEHEISEILGRSQAYPGLGDSLKTCSEGIMRGAWVEIIIIGTHTLRAPVPIDSNIDTHQVESVRQSSSEVLRTHKENQTEGAMPPGYSSCDDRCGIVRVAA